MAWSIVYKKAYNDDGTLFFPERLSEDFLTQTRKTQGPYLFANQYLNEVFPDEERKFRPEWIRYYQTLPENTWTFAYVDPAISTEDGRDYTALTVVSVTSDRQKYVRHASRNRLTPPEIIDLFFEVHKQYQPMAIGVEVVAYQKALMYMAETEMKKRGVNLPLFGINPGTTQTKEMRILGLVPDFYWNRIFLSPGLYDLEQELLQFPRASHDDILDSLASQAMIIQYPPPNHRSLPNAGNPHSTDYERKIIQDYVERANHEIYDGDDL